MKNPFSALFLKDTGANNRFKNKLMLRKLILTSICFLFITSLFAASFAGQSTATKVKGAAIYSLIVAFPAGQKGTLKDHGHDETDEEFAARKGKAETAEAFAKRFMANEIAEGIKRATEEWKKDLEKLQTDLKALKPNDEEGLEAIKKEMRKHGLQIQELKDIKIGLDRSIKKGSIAELLAQNKEKIAALKSRTIGNFSLELKTHATDTSTDIANRNYYDSEWHEPGQVGQLAVRQPFIQELFKNQNTSSEFMKYRDQNTAVRTAANVALCAASNTTTKLTWVTNTMQITKIRDYVDVCLDMINDYAFVEGEIRNLIDSSVNLKVDDQLLVGNGTHPETNSLTSIASTWAANIAGTKDWTTSVPLANLVDLIIVAQTQIQELGKMNKFMPNYVLLNPGDWASLMLIKNSFGDSIKYYPGLYVDNAGNIRINGMLLVANPNIAVDTFWIGDFRKGTVYTIPGVGIEFSYENSTNFETETVTVKAYKRLNLLVRTVDTNAFMNVPSIATALAAIVKP